MSTTYTPETLAAEMECRALDASQPCDRATLCGYAWQVRALAPERQEPPTVAPERRWEYRCINGQQNILAALAAGYELAAPPYVGLCTTNGHTTSWVEAFVRTPLILAEPAVPAATPDGELVALRAARQRALDLADQFDREHDELQDSGSPEEACGIALCGDQLRAALELPAPEVSP